MTTSRSAASGVQIAFLTFAVVFLAVPLTHLLAKVHPWSPEVMRLLDKAIPFLMGLAVLLAFGSLRRECGRLLQPRIPAGAELEVAGVTLLHVLTPFAWAGGVALFYWTASGEAGLAHLIRSLPSHEFEMRRAFEPAELVRNFVVIVVLAPVVEELVFRGFLYSAWERQWGWVPAALLSSLLFATYHANFLPAFVGGLLYAGLFRRTGSLRSAIVCHMAFNALLWYPALGRSTFPRDLDAPGDLASWEVQLACMVACSILVPLYVWIARKPRDAEPAFPPTVVHGALSE